MTIAGKISMNQTSDKIDATLTPFGGQALLIKATALSQHKRGKRFARNDDIDRLAIAARFNMGRGAEQTGQRLQPLNRPIDLALMNRECHARQNARFPLTFDASFCQI